MGVLAVAVIMLTGFGNARFLIGDAGALLTTDYGRVLLFKVGLFALMLVAATNRFRLMPRLASLGTMPMSIAVLTLSALRRTVLCEQVLGILVLVAANALRCPAPTAGLALDVVLRALRARGRSSFDPAPTLRSKLSP